MDFGGLPLKKPEKDIQNPPPQGWRACFAVSRRREQPSSGLLQNPPVGGDGHHLPGDEFATLLEGLLHRQLDAAAAGHLHAHDGDAPDIVLPDDLRQLFGIVHAVQLGAAHQGDVPLDEPLVETPQAQQTSRLSQWPVQIKLVPVNAPYFDGARLLIAADCTAYAYAAFHERFIKGHITLVGCPKLDSVDYSEKLTEIIRSNDIKSVTVVRMEVPCCGGLELAAKKALRQSGKFIPWQVVTVTVDGRLKEE